MGVYTLKNRARNYFQIIIGALSLLVSWYFQIYISVTLIIGTALVIFGIIFLLKKISIKNGYVYSWPTKLQLASVQKIEEVIAPIDRYRQGSHLVFYYSDGTKKDIIIEGYEKEKIKQEITTLTGKKIVMSDYKFSFPKKKYFVSSAMSLLILFLIVPLLISFSVDIRIAVFVPLIGIILINILFIKLNKKNQR